MAQTVSSLVILLCDRKDALQLTCRTADVIRLPVGKVASTRDNVVLSSKRLENSWKYALLR
jgi:hypothetical protein